MVSSECWRGGGQKVSRESDVAVVSIIQSIAEGILLSLTKNSKEKTKSPRRTSSTTLSIIFPIL